MLDVSESERARQDRVKGLLIHSGNRDLVAAYFPEYFEPQDPFAKAKTDDGYDIDLIDDAEIDWDVADPDEDEEMSRWISERSNGSFTAADLDENPWT